MRCDLHVHTFHSGMCTVPVLRRICRESYSDPREVYETLKRRGMDLVTVTDHDSIGAAGALKRYPDFFLSEEVSCVTPDGNRLHAGVYDIEERHHEQLQRRRDDLLSLIFYLQENRLIFSVNHAFSRLTGRRSAGDFVLFEHYFPLLETLNGQMPDAANRTSSLLARLWRKSPIAGSDAHTLGGLASAWTAVRGARSKAEYIDGLRHARGDTRGESGSYWKLTRCVCEIARGLFRERPWALALAPLLLLVPAATLANGLAEAGFHRRWRRRTLPSLAADRSALELEVRQVEPQLLNRVLDERH